MVVIKELLPNPIGKDGTDELIVLFNESDQPASLNQWTIIDEGKKSFDLSGLTVQPRTTLELPITLTKIQLNNAGDAVFLFDSKGEKVDELRYPSAAEGEIITSFTLQAKEVERQDAPSRWLQPTEAAGILHTTSSAYIGVFFVGLFLALCAGALVGVFSKHLIENSGKVRFKK